MHATGHPPSETPRRHPGLIFIFVTVMIDMLAFGIIIPVLPHLIVQLIGGSIAKAAVWSGAFGALFMLMQFIFSPVQGTLSDRFGRRTVILISSFGLGADFILMALAPALRLLFVGRAISGVCAASFSTANAYIADITTKEKRAAAFGTLGAAFGIGFIVGPALGGLAGPPAQAMMTQMVDPHEHARLQGALTSLASLTGIFGPVMFANLFALFISDHAPVRHLPGVSFLLAAVLLAAAALIAIKATRRLATDVGMDAAELAPDVPFRHFTPEPPFSPDPEQSP